MMTCLAITRQRFPHSLHLAKLDSNVGKSHSLPPKPPNLSVALCDLDLWPPDPQSWQFHALAPWITRANWHLNRFIHCVHNDNRWMSVQVHDSSMALPARLSGRRYRNKRHQQDWQLTIHSRKKWLHTVSLCDCSMLGTSGNASYRDDTYVMTDFSSGSATSTSTQNNITYITTIIHITTCHQLPAVRLPDVLHHKSQHNTNWHHRSDDDRQYSTTASLLLGEDKTI